MLNKIIRKITMSLVLSIIFVVIGYFIAFPISNYYHADFKDVMFLEGLITTIIATFFSIQRGPSPSTLHQGLNGDRAWQYAEYKNLETTMMEGKSTGYQKKFTNHSVVKLIFNSLTIIFGGILIMLFSIFLV